MCSTWGCWEPNSLKKIMVPHLFGGTRVRGYAGTRIILYVQLHPPPLALVAPFHLNILSSIPSLGKDLPGGEEDKKNKNNRKKFPSCS